MALGWLALQLSNSAFVVGAVAASSALPIVLFSLYAGVVVDRSDKLSLVRMAQLLLVLEGTALWWLTWTGHISIPILITLAIFGGIATSVEIPARQSLMIELVGKDDLRDAIALNSSGFNLARIFGPALGAAVIAGFGIAWCFAVNALSYGVVQVSLALIKLPRREIVPSTQSPWQELRAGVSYVLGDRRLRGLVAVIAVLSILGIPTISLMPVMARDQLHLAADGYGILLSAVGLGGLCGALALAASSRRLPRGRVLTMSQTICAVLVFLLSLTRSMSTAYPLLLATGFVFIVNSALGNTILQSIVPDEYRGRLMSIYSLIVVGLPQVVGSFLAGSVAKVAGMPLTLAAAGLIMLGYSQWAFRKYPELKKL